MCSNLSFVLLPMWSPTCFCSRCLARSLSIRTLHRCTRDKTNLIHLTLHETDVLIWVDFTKLKLRCFASLLCISVEFRWAPSSSSHNTGFMSELWCLPPPLELVFGLHTIVPHPSTRSDLAVLAQSLRFVLIIVVTIFFGIVRCPSSVLSAVGRLCFLAVEEWKHFLA